MEPKEIKIIAYEGEVLLRELSMDDATHLIELANNDCVRSNLRETFPFPYSEVDARQYIQKAQQKKSGFIFAIEYRGKYAGTIVLNPGTDVYQKSAEIGYFIGEPFWNKGIATIAVRVITEWGFENLDINRIYASVFDYNFAAQRVLEKAGYKQEAVFEKAVFKRGRFHDEVRYAFVR
jgi:[ribosomal protein S5]-alanine N-acetyltransferase